MGIPTLQEIANMPFSKGQDAMRTYYDRQWGKYFEAGESRIFSVNIEYSYSVHDHEVIEVEACSEEEALDLAEEELEKLVKEDYEITNIEAREA